ncbi:MAG: hypothetical protein KBC34_01075 [Phenylobacterium sp.]|nr:hypothetical protein [Phenylobacterium sp.]
MDRAWTLSCIATVHMLNVGGAAPSQIAFTLNRSEREIDRALWALVGRSIPDAQAALNMPIVLTLRAAR